MADQPVAPGTYWVKVVAVASGNPNGPTFPPKDEIVSACQAGLTAAGINATASN
jgi:hypothetical protein